MEPLINSEEVTAMFKDCLFRDAEVNPPPTDFVKTNGIAVNIEFHPTRLDSHKRRIGEIVGNLSKEFVEGGGWTFLNMCLDKNGNQWTSFHKVQDQLLCLAVGTNQGKILMAEMASVMPGGVPYVQFKPGGFNDTLPEVQPVSVEEPGL